MRTLFVSFYCLILVTAFPQKQVPELWGHRIHDDAHVLKQETIDLLEARLKTFEDSTSNQIAILLVPSLDGAVLEEYSLKVAEQWQLGQEEKDNGALFFVAVDDHKMRIEVGHGLEGVLTDAMSSRIIRNDVAPHFRRDDYDAGVAAAVESIIKTIGGEYTAEGDSGTMGDTLAIGAGILIVLFFFIFTLFPLVREILRLFRSKGKITSNRTSGSTYRSASSWSSSSSSSSSGSSFSGGGGSFGGGGSSGSW